MERLFRFCVLAGVTAFCLTMAVATFRGEALAGVNAHVEKGWAGVEKDYGYLPAVETQREIERRLKLICVSMGDGCGPAALPLRLGDLVELEIEAEGDFVPDALVVFACRELETLIWTMHPSEPEYRARAAVKINTGECFYAPKGIPAMRVEKVTHVSAEGDRPALDIWRIEDQTGASAFASFVPE